jgi:hypothetical protein
VDDHVVVIEEHPFVAVGFLAEGQQRLLLEMIADAAPDRTKLAGVVGRANDEKLGYFADLPEVEDGDVGGLYFIGYSCAAYGLFDTFDICLPERVSPAQAGRFVILPGRPSGRSGRRI